MIINEGLQNAIPDAKNIDDAAAIYHQFYSKDDEEKFGVVGIKIIKKK